MEFLHSPTATAFKLVVFVILTVGLSIKGKNRMDQILAKRMEDESRPILPVYWKAMATGVLFAALGLIFGGLGIVRIPSSLQYGFSQMGLTNQDDFISMICGFVVAIGVIFVLEKLRAKTRFRRRKPSRSLVHPMIVFFLPCSPPERQLWVLVSICAGVFEEIAFRGYFFQALSLLGCGLFLVWILNAVLFGALHVYQGWKGFICTGLLGLFMAILYSLSGLLIVPIIVHILFDLRILKMKPKAIDEMRKAARAASNAAQVNSV